MNLLLDSHALLWWLLDDPELATKAREAIGDGDNLVFVSAASIWELRIKQALGKLDLPEDFREVLATQSFLSLDVSAEHALAVGDLPAIHRDPFDRMLIAQAKLERLTLVTRDSRLKGYGVPLLGA
jgi:PIN domain nuclease of toxin-antitoxin system